MIEVLLSTLYNKANAQIISQYVETNMGVSPKGIEIWNNTPLALDFETSNLIVQVGTNGTALINLVTVNTGSLEPGAVLVIGTAEIGTWLTNQGLTAVRFIQFTFVFNGDDALAIKYGDAITDIFGTPGVDPGYSWSGGTVNAANQDIQLKIGILTGDIDGWSDPSLRFETVSVNPTSPYGLIGFGIPPVTSPTISVMPDTLSGFNYSVNTGPSFSQVYYIKAFLLTPASGNITITPSDAYEISLNGFTYYSDFLTLPYSDSTITPTLVFVRLKKGLPLGNYFGETVINAGGGAPTVQVYVNGNVTMRPQDDNCDVLITHSAGQNIICGEEKQLNTDFVQYWMNQHLPTAEYTGICMTSPGIAHSVTPGDFLNNYHRFFNNEWHHYAIGNNNINLQALQFISSSTGFAGGSRLVDKYQSTPALFHTTNNGENWSEINTGITSFDTISCIKFTTPGQGFIGTSDGIFKTIDEGLTWQHVLIGPRILNIDFPDLNTGYSAGSNSIYKSIDGGNTWTLLYYFSSIISDLHFLNELNGIVIGANKLCKKTTDGGLTWQDCNIQVATNSYLSDIHFYNNEEGYIGGTAPALYKTTDGGLNWNSVPYIKYKSIGSLYFYDENNGFASGSGLISRFPGTNNTILEYEWIGAGLSDYTNPSPVAYPNQDVSYVVTVSVDSPIYTCTASDTLDFLVNPLTISADNMINSCMVPQTINAQTNYKGNPDKISYTWTPADGLDNPNVIQPVLTVTGNQAYQIIAETNNGCIANDDMYVNITAFSGPEICMITVDQSKNQVIWNPAASSEIIDHYSVYKETGITNNFELIGTVPSGNPCIFIDTASMPNVLSNRYKITYTDICGIETGAGTPHKSVHLSISEGQNGRWNLNWEPYAGFEVTSYNIYRGMAEDNMTLLATVPSSVNQYTDLAPPSDVYYQIEVLCPYYCNPYGRDFNTSKSNIEHGTVLGFSQKELSSITIYPNPASNLLKVDIQKDHPAVGMHGIEAYNVMGELIDEFDISKPGELIDVSHLRNGVYILKVNTTVGIFTARVIIID